MVGMRDVAKKAGVSISTVSLVINNNGYVSEAMRDRVNAAMQDLDYVPNGIARNLSLGRTDTVGVIIPTVQHPFFSQLTARIQHYLDCNGLRTILCSTADQPSGEQQYIDMLKRHTMDAIIMGSHSSYSEQYWDDIDRPVVAFDRFLCEDIPSVGSDHIQAGRIIAGRLMATGAKHVVEIGGPRTQFHDRQYVSSKALNATSGRTLGQLQGSSNLAVTRNFSYPERPLSSAPDSTFPTVRYHMIVEQTLTVARVRYDYISVDNVSDFDRFPAAAREAFDKFPDVDAIVAPDLAAAFCVQEGLARGRKIPEDLQIIAFDGTIVARSAGYPITTVCQDFDGIAQQIVKRAVQQIELADEENSLHTSYVFDAIPVFVQEGKTTRL